MTADLDSTATALGSALADAFLAGTWTQGALVARGRATLAPKPAWIPALAREVLATFPRPPVQERRAFAVWVSGRVRERPLAAPRPRVVRRFVVEAVPGRLRWGVPELAGAADVAAWLGLASTAELAWFADARGLERFAARRLRHYDVSWVARPDARARVLEAPRPRLKALQRRALDELLVRIPLHDAAHGFVRGRSAVTHARAHVGARVVLRADLEDCFAAVTAGRVFGVLRSVGYGDAVAHVLTGLCTTSLGPRSFDAIPVPRDPTLIPVHRRLGRLLAAPHLPQGAPTSPALANLVLFRLDRRLAGLAAASGATYTLYADDIVFSGGDRVLAGAERMRRTVSAVCAEEGFAVNERKGGLMTSGGRQRVAGAVVNARTNAPREEVDRLRAMLHRAALDGPSALRLPPEVIDPRAHLLGRIAWVAALNPQRGARLRALADAVDWER